MAATTNEVLSKPVVTISAAKMNEEMGEFRTVANELRPETRDKGSTINVYTRMPSQVYSGLIGLPNGKSASNPEQMVNVVIDSSFTYDALSTRDLSNDVLKREEQILAPLRVGLQYDLKNKFYNGNMSAGNQTIAAATPGRLTWGDLAKGLAAVRHSGVGGRLAILLPEQGFAALMDTTQNAFLPSSNEEMFRNKLGTFGGADVYRTIVEGQVAPSGNFTVSGTPAWGGIPGTGWGIGSQSFIQTGSNSGVVLAGTQFQIPGIYAMNIYRKSTGNLATFTCLYDIDLSTGMPVDEFSIRPKVPVGAIPVGKALGMGFLSRLPVSGDILTAVNATDNPLNSVLVYSEKAFAFASATPAKRFLVEEESSSNEGGINIRTGIQGTNEGGLTSFRMDVLTGSNGVWSPGAVSIVY